MIEFTLNRNRNGKKSRWAKKYPRISKSQDGKYLIDPYYITYSEYKWSNNKELPDYVFLTKEEKISD